MSTATKLPPADTGACGTSAGYGRHRRRRELACGPCVTATNKARRDGRTLMRPGTSDTTPLAAFGSYAGLDVPHAFEALFPTMGLPICRHCLGYSDDARHL